MKYFTSEWWSAGCRGDASSIYARYLASVKNQLPPAVVQLDAEHTLHDSEVKKIQSDFSSGSVSLQLHGWDQALENKVRYYLHFSQVSAFEQTYPQEEDVESELEDLGYWEWEVVPAGIEARMLFVSSAEFRIVFREFAFSHARI